MTENDVNGVNRVGADGFLEVQRLGDGASHENLVQQMPADQRHKLHGDLKRAVLATFAREGDVQINLRKRSFYGLVLRTFPAKL